MQIKANERSLIKQILQTQLPNAEYRVFGSRIKNTARPYSDIDIALVSPEKISLATLSLLEEKFSESDLPYKVDLIDYQRISDSFRRIIDSDYQRL
jgi:predicted nucleotidyltransferase